MQKGYLSVPSSDAEKQPWFNEKQFYSPTSPLIVEESKNPLRFTKWINRISYFFMSSRQKEKSTRKSIMIRSRTRGIKLFATFLFCTISMYFIHRFFGNYVQLSLPTETVSDMFKSIPSSDHIKQYATTYSSKSHPASSDSDRDLANWTRDSWIKFGVTDTKIETYWPLLNYPNRTGLAVIQGPSHLLYQSPMNNISLPFHAYSGNGDVTGPVVYVNYGRLSDFQFLIARGISFQGTIALIRNGVIKKGLKVKMAEDFGCIGAVLFSDPDDNDTNTNATGPAVVEQGSVQYSSYIVGDPLTQGYAAVTETNATHRITYDEATGIPKIPSLPISWQDAEALLKTTEGFGIQSDITWLGGICDLNYYSGPSEALTNLINFNDYKVKPIWNVVGKITGNEEPNRAIIIGNHRDAWIHGAIDPSSGSAVLMELVRTIGILIERGWRPRRTLIIASWDAQEYGSVGSTEWVEDHQSWLKEEAVAYLNVDYAVSGKTFSAQSSPILSQLLYEVTKEVIDPQTSQSVYDIWKLEKSTTTDFDHDFYFESDNVTPLPLTEPLGSDSDYAGFFNHLGISSASFGFRGKENIRHTSLDTMSWMETIGDPTFEYHQTLTRIWGLLVLRLTSDILLPMHSLDYSVEIVRHMDHLISKQGCLSLPFISTALHSLSATSYHFEKKRNKWAHKFAVHKHISKKLKKHAEKANNRIMQFERAFIDPLGISHERPWFKHVVYGPDLNTGLPKEFPGLSDAVENGNTVYTRYIEERIGKLLLDAEKALRGKSNDFEEEDEDEDDDNDY